MQQNKVLRRALGLFLVGVVALGGYAYTLFSKQRQVVGGAQVLQMGQVTDQNAVPIGGDFILTDVHGRKRDSTQWRGRFVMVYFGYSYCPDICPAALDHMTQALQKLGQYGKKIQPVFITIDPDRDTKEQMKSYMENYHPTFVSLTGTQEELDLVIKKFKVVARKVKDDGTPVAPEDKADDYLVDHSSIIYLMDPQGKFVAHFNHLTPPDNLAQGLAAQLKS